MSTALGRKGLAYAALGASHLVARQMLGLDDVQAGARRLLISENGESLSTGTQTAYIITCIALVAISGLAAGLTLGLLSIDRVDLEIIKRTGTAKQVWMASQVEPLLSNTHWLLVALLLCNAGAFEALPIFLDRLLNPVAAILISVSAILVFGEILPQAVCKRYGMQIGAYLSWLVRIVMIVTAPISWPLAKCLDWMLGEETALFRRAELRELVALHAEPDEDGGESMLTAEEVQVIHGALDMAHKTAETAMTPLANVFAVDADAPLDRTLFEAIIAAGHSRVPVYDKGDKRNIIGLILVKELILVDQSRKMKVRDCLLRDVDFIVASTPLYSVMELFRLKRRHMAVLTRGEEALSIAPSPSASVHGGVAINGGGAPAAAAAAKLAAEAAGEEVIPLKATHTRGSSITNITNSALNHAGGPYDVIGVITIEDVIEELLNVEIVDETDVFIDNEQTKRVPDTSGRELPPKLSKYLSMKRKGKVPSARPSPSKADKQAAAAAAASAAAWAAAKTQGLNSRRVQSAAMLAPGEGGDAAAGAPAGQQPQQNGPENDDKGARPSSSML